MRKFCAMSALAGMAICAFAADPISTDEYRSRRAQLREKLDGTLVLFGRAEGRDDVFRARQEPNFYYLTGFTTPGGIVLLTRNTETLFLGRHNERREIYNGRRTAPEDPDARARTGFETVLPIEKFEAALAKAVESGEPVYALSGRPETARLKQLLPLREISDAGPVIAHLRVKKSEAEIAAIEHTTNVTIEAQRAAWKRIHPGIFEYQAVATFTAALLEAGCEGYSYAPIFGSGPNSTVLHYSADSRRMDAGEVMVIDAAAECGAYASDVTRTVPVNGKFTPRQREIYDIVLGAQKAVIAAIKPGVLMADLTKIARDYINSHGKDLHGNSLGKYLPHGVSHQVGLDVHDPGVTPSTLASGMVITVEPGIYLPEENIGVRIEDVVLVTGDGSRVLSAALPREPDEVEKALAR
jgi:Xaa-Pro aminopeptidase